MTGTVLIVAVLGPAVIPPGYGKINSNSTEITQCSYGSVGQYRTGWLTGNQVNTDLAVCQTCGTNFKGVTNDELIVYTYNNSTGDYESSIANVAASTGNCCECNASLCSLACVHNLRYLSLNLLGARVAQLLSRS